MSAPKHTPGPYRVTKFHDVIRVRQDATDAVLATIEDGGHINPKFNLSLDEQRANALLFGAAPELLEALQIARCNMSYLQVGDRDADGEELEDCTIRAWNSDLAKIDAAIAKATGQ